MDCKDAGMTPMKASPQGARNNCIDDSLNCKEARRTKSRRISISQVLRLRELWCSKKTECLTSHRGACGESPYETKWK